MKGEKALLEEQLKRAVVFICLIFITMVGGCSDEHKSSQNVTVMDIGEFSCRSLDHRSWEITDGTGRRFLLLPRTKAVPAGFEGLQIIRIPVRRVVAYSGFTVSMMKAIGSLDTLKGVTKDKGRWTIKAVKNGIEKGDIVFLGNPSSIDYERLKEISPDLVLTWDQTVVSKLSGMGIPVIVTTTGRAMDIETRMRFARFLALFFNKEKEAEEYIQKVQVAINRIKAMDLRPSKPPKVIWGDIYEKRVRVEPGNSWVAQLIRLSGGKYLFEDISGAS